MVFRDSTVERDRRVCFSFDRFFVFRCAQRVPIASVDDKNVPARSRRGNFTISRNETRALVPPYVRELRVESRYGDSVQTVV